MCSIWNVNQIERIDNDFWKEVLKAYLQFKTPIHLEHVSKSNFHSQLLFNNDLIKYKNKTIFFPNWQKKGIEKIKDIIHPTENRLLTLTEISNIVHNQANTIFECNALINSIPLPWIQWIHRGERDTELLTLDVSKFNTKPKYIKKILNVVREEVLPCSFFFWRRTMNFSLNKSVWLRAFEITKETRLRVLNWKILHNIYPTNILLNKMKIKETNRCSYCPDQIDYMEHFFCSCPAVHDFWIHIEKNVSL